PTTPVYRAWRERSLVHPSAATASGRGLATAVRRGLLGFLLRVLLAPEDGLAVLRIDEDGVALLEFSGAHLLRERVDDEPLDRALAGEILLLRELGDERRADVARHDDQDVLEGDRSALAVSETAVVEDLQEHIEDVGMRLLDLVQQED